VDGLARARTRALRQGTGHALRRHPAFNETIGHLSHPADNARLIHRPFARRICLYALCRRQPLAEIAKQPINHARVSASDIAGNGSCRTRQAGQQSEHQLPPAVGRWSGSAADSPHPTQKPRMPVCAHRPPPGSVGTRLLDRSAIWNLSSAQLHSARNRFYAGFLKGGSTRSLTDPISQPRG
jgi:hypothetical protein